MAIAHNRYSIRLNWLYRFPQHILGLNNWPPTATEIPVPYESISKVRNSENMGIAIKLEMRELQDSNYSGDLKTYWELQL